MSADKPGASDSAPLEQEGMSLVLGQEHGSAVFHCGGILAQLLELRFYLRFNKNRQWKPPENRTKRRNGVAHGTPEPSVAGNVVRSGWASSGAARMRSSQSGPPGSETRKLSRRQSSAAASASQGATPA